MYIELPWVTSAGDAVETYVIDVLITAGILMARGDVVGHLGCVAINRDVEPNSEKRIRIIIVAEQIIAPRQSTRR